MSDRFRGELVCTSVYQDRSMKPDYYLSVRVYPKKQGQDAKFTFTFEHDPKIGPNAMVLKEVEMAGQKITEERLLNKIMVSNPEEFYVARQLAFAGLIQMYDGGIR